MTTSACKILLKNKNKQQNRKLYEPKKKTTETKNITFSWYRKTSSRGQMILPLDNHNLYCSEVLNYIYMYIHLCHGNHIKRIEFEFIGVLCHMQWYFSHICDGTDVQADWRSRTYDRAPNAIDISQGSLTWPSYADTGHPFYTVIPTHRPILSPSITRWGYIGRILDLNPRCPHGG